jgi:beta-lactamase superfamily II metal-dependent hydrolase
MERLVDDAGRTADDAVVTIRMYSVGFGDCFLVTVRRPEDPPWRMLVDCGVHGLGVRQPMGDVISDLLSEVSDTGTPRLDLVVVTHRHQDHVSGFADRRWQDVEVGEVWLPWSEDPGDPEAQRARTALDGMARTLALRLAGVDDDVSQMALNSLSNEKAMSTLQQGFAGQPARSYLSADKPDRRDAPGLRRGRIFVLGPTKDERAVRRMNPPRPERWFEGADGAAGGRANADGDLPFDEPYVVRVGAARADRAAYEQGYPDLAVSDKLWTSLNPPAQADPLVTAAWLDRAINNTSLVFVLEVGEVRVLFAGDAQWGVWEGILRNPDARQLLAQVDAVKVGHHGSHNGTPRSLAESILRDDVVSLMSVTPMSRWEAIPAPGLVESLNDDQRSLVRADEPPLKIAPSGVSVERTELWTEVTFDQQGTSRPPVEGPGEAMAMVGEEPPFVGDDGPGRAMQA